MGNIEKLLTELRALAEKATPAPWKSEAVERAAGTVPKLAAINAPYIAALRNNHDLLERLVREMAAEIAELERIANEQAKDDGAQLDGVAHYGLAAVEERVWGKG